MTTLDLLELDFELIHEDKSVISYVGSYKNCCVNLFKNKLWRVEKRYTIQGNYAMAIFIKGIKLEYHYLENL